MKKYKVLFTVGPPEMAGLWDGAAWGSRLALEISHWRPESSAHRPRTLCKLLYNRDCIYGIFRVEDRYVRCTHSEFQSHVYKDSCVEFFVQPKAAGGYFNFEFNCGGTLLASYVTDATRIEGKVKECIPLEPDEDLQIKRYHSLPKTVAPEITSQVIWFLEFAVPFVVLEKYTGVLAETSGQLWRANFYKCGNDTSHPHWGSWSEVSALNFHLPAEFGEIEFLPR